jgi:hypothetical protein
MKKIVFYITIFIVLEATFGQKKTEIYPYVSPGIRIGYMFDQGFTFSSEVTGGVVGGVDMIWHSSIALGYQD